MNYTTRRQRVGLCRVEGMLQEGRPVVARWGSQAIRVWFSFIHSLVFRLAGVAF
jgi:hypothetical protein